MRKGNKAVQKVMCFALSLVLFAGSVLTNVQTVQAEGEGQMELQQEISDQNAADAEEEKLQQEIPDPNEGNEEEEKFQQEIPDVNAEDGEKQEVQQELPDANAEEENRQELPQMFLRDKAENGEQVELQQEIPHTKTNGDTNKFTFAEGKWETGNNEHTWSKAVDANDPGATWYQVDFVGHKIDIYSGKNRPMGKVEYFIDGQTYGEFDLYNSSNINSTFITTIELDSEGPHIFKAVATGTKNDSASNTLIDAAKVVVYYYENMDAAPELHGSIMDTSLQYTQEKYETVTTAHKTTEVLTAWKNDTAVSEISVAAKTRSLENVTARASAFSGEEGTIPAENVKLDFIKSVQAYTGLPGYGSTTRPVPEGDRKEANEVIWQDAGTPVEIPFHQLQNIWVSVEVPKDAAAGTYTGTVTVSANEVESLVFTYTLEVADAVLPDAEEFEDGFDIELWQNPFIVAEYYNVEPFSEEHFNILRPHMEKYKSIGGHAITTTIVDDAWAGQTYSANAVKYPSMIQWTKKTDGSFSFDYTKFDKWIQFNKELGIGDKIICYSIAPWNNAITYYDEATGSNQTVSVTPGTETYTTMWTAFLQNLMVHMESKGWKEETYIGIDERGFDTRAFDLIDSITGIDAKPFKTAGAMDGFVTKKDLAMRVDDLNVGSVAIKEHPTEFEQIRQERENAGLRTTVYTCTGHKPGNFSLSAPGESYWTMMYSYSVGGEGYLRWAYDSWVADPLRDTTHNAFEAGDCFLIFPDEKDAENPVSKSSLRLEKMAEGVRDVNKLVQMKKEVPSMAEQVDSLMDTIKPTYDSGSLYLTDNGKETLAQDMASVKAQIAELTEEYITRKANGTNEVESVSITEGSETKVSLRESKSLHVQLAPENLLNTQVVWTSDNEAIVSVSNKGVVTGNKVGRAAITATSVQDPSKSATITITVERLAVEADAQVSYYSFDQVENNAVTDQWGSRNGTNENGTIVDGKSGKAIEIASGNKVTFPENTDLTQNWTVGYWMYNTSAGTGRCSVMTDKDGVRSFDNRISDSNAKGGVHVNASSGGYLTFNYQAPQNTWVHVAWTNDRTNGLCLYVNGQLIQTNAWTKTNDFKAPIDILGGEGFTGKIDELKIYNRALTASEVAAIMQVKGLNVSETSVNLNIGETYTITTDLISDEEDQTITFSSSAGEIASVDENGVVTAHKKGTAIITVENKAGGYKEEVSVAVTKPLVIQYTIPQYELPEENLSDIEKKPGTDRQYLGQPDMIMLKDNKTLYTAYPVGHGCGPLVMKVSTDAGETWTEKTDIPASWAGSLETPTMYRLDMTDGTTKLIMITGRPYWHGNTVGGWQTSISEDDGKTWSEYKTFQQTLPDGRQNYSIVAMASLIQLKDEDGNDIDKWMGVYHDTSYVNYKTYLTFDEEGNEQWSAPEPYLTDYRSMESTYQICEVGMFRSPDGKRIMALARSQSHNHKSVMFYSDDEGETWSRPEEMQGALQGERHKAVYDPISGRLVVTFREIILDYNQNGVIENNDWMAGDWIAWVGTYEDLLEQNEGQYRILLEEDWANNAKSGDTGYAGIVVQPDGTFIMDSYGHWDKDFSLSWSGGVTTDLCYIKQAKFKLGEVDNALNLVDRKALQEEVEKVKDTSSKDYTEESFQLFEDALKQAQEMLEDKTAQQIQIDNALTALQTAHGKLEQKTAEPEKPDKPVQPDKPDKPEQPGTTDKQPQYTQNGGTAAGTGTTVSAAANSKAAKTGDMADITGTLLFALTGAAGMAVLGMKRRRKAK